MNTLLARFNVWMTARTPQERKLLLLGAAVVAVALIFSLAEWTWKEQARLQRRLPEARQQLARMQEEAAELQRLKRSPTVDATPLVTLAQSAEAAARSRGLDVKMQTSPDALEINGGGSFQMVADWLATLQSDHNLRPHHLSMNDNGDGTVSFTALLMPTILP